MEKKDSRTIHRELAQPFAAEDLGWRLQRTFEYHGKMTGIAVPYVTNRAIMNRLDSVVGPENWYNDFKPWHTVGKKESQLCGISIYFEERGFITKWDGAEDSDIESVKGGLSDSMKRAAVQWGIGRALYNMDTVFVEVEQRGKSWIIEKNQRAKLDKAYLDMLSAMGLKPVSAGGVQSLLEDSDGEPDTSLNRTGTPAIPPKGGGASKEKRPPANQSAREPETNTALNQPQAAYVVTAMQMQKGMKATNTTVKLKDVEGKELTAFVQGEHPILSPGAMLSEAKLSMRKQDTVVYYVLESYQIIPPDQRAA